MRAVNCTRYGSLALVLCATWFTAEPMASIFSFRLRDSSPNIWLSLPIWLTASSPRSSPNATLIWFAASTNSRTSCTPVMPSLPASPANWFSSSRGVRVSIALNSSFSCFTSSAVMPVYLMTWLSASSIWAYSSTHLRMVSVMPVSVARALAPMAA